MGIQSKRVRTNLSSVLGPFLWSSVTAGEHTREADRSARVTSGSLPPLERPEDLSPSLERPVELCLQSKITDLVLSSQDPCGYMNILFTHVFFCLWLVIRTYILPLFFPVIYWSYLRIEISVTLSIGNKLYSCRYILYFSFLWKLLCWCYLATSLNLVSSSSQSKLVYYNTNNSFWYLLCLCSHLTGLKYLLFNLFCLI